MVTQTEDSLTIVTTRVHQECMGGQRDIGSHTHQTTLVEMLTVVNIFVGVLKTTFYKSLITVGEIIYLVMPKL